MRISALIVDDEPMARERIADLLRSRGDVDILGECGNGLEAIDAIRRQRPDLVFMDVQMPEMGGFEAIETLDEAELPEIIFTTAYDKFALRAFEVHAVDYLLKPFERDRFFSALEAARMRVQARVNENVANRMSTLVEELRSRSSGPAKIAIKTEGRILLVEVDDIQWVEAAGNYAELHTAVKSHLVRETMTRLAERLPEEDFVRINRSAIVNLASVRELQPSFHGEYTVFLKDGAKLKLSRTHRDKLDRLLGNRNTGL
jgi:two-component system LytT family response regulator